MLPYLAGLGAFRGKLIRQRPRVYFIATGKRALANPMLFGMVEAAEAYRVIVAWLLRHSPVSPAPDVGDLDRALVATRHAALMAADEVAMRR